MAVGLFLFCGAGGSEAVAQGAVNERSPCVSVAVAPDHWSVGALRRLQALGAIRDYLPVQRTPTLCEAHALFEESVDDAPKMEVAELAEDLKSRLEWEFPGLAERSATGSSVLHFAAGAQAAYRAGAAAPGEAEFYPERTGALPMADRTLAAFEADLGLYATRKVALRGELTADREGSRFQVLEGVVGLGPVLLTVGRGEVGFGTAEGGGVVLSRGRFDRVQLSSRGSWRAGGLLGPLRRVGFTTFVSRLNEERHPNDPYFWGASASFQPHWRSTFFVHRGAMIRTDGEFPVTARNLASLLIGDVAGGGFENQIVSVEGRFHLPTEGVVPITAYLEWGAEDAAGGWWDVPARIVGVQVPAFPGAPGMSAGIERASYAITCCGNPMWYRHWSFPGAWVLQEKPLGHPLGGNGTEWLGYGGFDGGAGLRLDARAFRRNRGPNNLYTPGREGKSWGGAGSLQWRTAMGTEIFGRFEIERGEGWQDRRASVGGRIAFGL